MDLTRITAKRPYWLEKAQEKTPVLHRERLRLVPPEQALPISGSTVVEAPGYVVGFVTLKAEPSADCDSPLRLKITCAEWPAELKEVPDPFRGTLSPAWLQEEVVTVDDMTAPFTLPRRCAFRWLKIEVLAAPSPVKITLVEVETVSAAGAPAVPEPVLPEAWRRIDRCALRTLRWCMQRVFEDGPKRDRRLWLGDLRLQAMVNAVSYRDFDLVERSLYLLAAFVTDDGRFPGCVFDYAVPGRGNVLLDYAVLLGPTLCDHLEFSGRREICDDLFEAALAQLAWGRRYFDDDGVFHDPGDVWIFVDWSSELNRDTAFSGIYLYALRRTARLAVLLGHGETAAGLESEAERIGGRLRRDVFDPVSGRVASGAKGQTSHAATAWLVLSGALTPEEGRLALNRVSADPAAVRPVTPYLWHHVAAAQFACGLSAAGRELLLGYWGSMLEDGADTFYEAWVPGEPERAVYGDRRLNSACHAWSCTPAYFIRTMPELFRA